MFISICGFSVKVTCAFLACKKHIKKVTEINTFPSQKTTLSFIFFYQIKVSRIPKEIVNYHICIEGHLNYAYSPFITKIVV